MKGKYSRSRPRNGRLTGISCRAAILLALTLLATTATAERVYKWTDDDGVVHYAATRPAEGDAERVSLPRHKPPTAAPATETTAAAEDGPLYAQAAPPDNSAIDAENRRKQCQKGRNMIAQIEPRPRVYRLDEDGNQVYLNDQERLDLLEEARQLVAEHCD